MEKGFCPNENLKIAKNVWLFYEGIQKNLSCKNFYLQKAICVKVGFFYRIC